MTISRHKISSCQSYSLKKTCGESPSYIYCLCSNSGHQQLFVVSGGGGIAHNSDESNSFWRVSCECIVRPVISLSCSLSVTVRFKERTEWSGLGCAGVYIACFSPPPPPLSPLLLLPDQPVSNRALVARKPPLAAVWVGGEWCNLREIDWGEGEGGMGGYRYVSKYSPNRKDHVHCTV